MNWISTLSQVFFGVLVTGGTGCVMLLIWFLCQKLLQKRNPKLVNYMLRWVVVMFMLPVTYVSIITNYDSGYVKPMESISKMLFVMDMNSLFFQGLAMIWFIATMMICAFFLKNEVAKHRMCKRNFDDGASLAQTEFERIKAELGIKGKVELLRNDDPTLESPFTVGMFKRKVVIPYRNYTKEELDVMLYHELNHVKKRDVLFRYLAMLAIIINSVNVISYFLWSNVLFWGETDCDARALDDLDKEGIDYKRYYDIIWKLIDNGPGLPTLFYYPMLVSSANTVHRRMEILESYRVNGKRTAKSVTLACVMVFALLSTVTAYAAGIGVAKLGDMVLKESQIIGDAGKFAENHEWSDEMMIAPSDDVEIIYINDGIMTLAGKSFDWEVPVDTRCVSASIYMEKGTVVSIACTAKPSDCLYWFGLMYASSECSVLEGSDSGNHDFTIPSNGYYRIMVENRSDEVIRAVGGYQY